ncbi:aspartate transaminase [Synchytrium microbalum]|uniref:Aspartate aminotransferase n=1 Tax=Synchytrium microbalum TaxID=1806994 RepID=A0A507BW79_9FUNG|nr:aspartate transaminase [Synchytrium microbalum]TPX33620.1 aspartate transaminase [Synchytrium microbalum]
MSGRPVGYIDALDSTCNWSALKTAQSLNLSAHLLFGPTRGSMYLDEQRMNRLMERCHNLRRFQVHKHFANLLKHARGLQALALCLDHDVDVCMGDETVTLFVTRNPVFKLNIKISNAVSSVSKAVFEKVEMAPPDAIFKVSNAFKADTDPKKINLGVGAYRDNNAKPWVLPVVRKAEKIILEDTTLDHEYLDMAGFAPFTEGSAKLILGASSSALKEGRVAAVQSISGTGGVRLAAELLIRFHKAPIYISNPTWANHHSIFGDAGFDIKTYPYWDPKTRGLAFEPMLATFKSAPAGSIILLHACAHNPTGVDPTPDQWKQMAEVIKERGHFPFFDCAYQGFASGDLDRDAWAVRYFVDQGFELLVAQSYAKNFGLYGERIGCVTAVLKTPEVATKVKSQLSRITRAMISTAPAFGARIVSLIFNNPQLYQEWIVNLKSMADRIIKMRQVTFDTLTQLKTPGTWNHIVDQIGMFSYTGLTPPQVKALADKFHIYLTDNGRISMAGLNDSNVKYFAESVDWVVRNIQ